MSTEFRDGRPGHHIPLRSLRLPVDGLDCLRLTKWSSDRLNGAHSAEQSRCAGDLRNYIAQLIEQGCQLRTVVGIDVDQRSVR
jgi:hypothetical protein